MLLLLLRCQWRVPKHGPVLACCRFPSDLRVSSRMSVFRCPMRGNPPCSFLSLLPALSIVLSSLSLVHCLTVSARLVAACRVLLLWLFCQAYSFAVRSSLAASVLRCMVSVCAGGAS
ncbi:hypothetical protein TRVL_09315 [Trypanosoma vivax]|nr:hypothetical protein TRVL_09315 [Trypanosoma vivax]